MRKHVGYRIFFVATTLSAVLISNIAQAATNTMSLTPSSKSMQINTTADFTVIGNSTDQVMAYEVNVTFDPAKLEYQASPTGYGRCNAASFQPSTETVTSGSVDFVCVAIPGFTGQQTVATLPFKALVGAGSAALAWGPQAAMSTSSTSNVMTGSSGATVSFTPIPTPTPPPPTPTPTPVPTATPKPNTTLTPGPQSTATPAPKPSTTPAPTAVPKKNDNKHDSKATPAPITQLTTLVAIEVKDTKGQPIEGATVTLDDKTAVTDATGVAGFIGVKPGKHNVKANTSKLGSATKSVNVTPTTNGSVQTYNLVLGQSSTTVWLIWTLVALGLMVALTGVVLFLRRRQTSGRLVDVPGMTASHLINSANDAPAPIQFPQLPVADEPAAPAATAADATPVIIRGGSRLEATDNNPDVLPATPKVKPAPVDTTPPVSEAPAEPTVAPESTPTSKPVADEPIEPSASPDKPDSSTPPPVA